MESTRVSGTVKIKNRIFMWQNLTETHSEVCDEREVGRNTISRWATRFRIRLDDDTRPGRPKILTHKQSVKLWRILFKKIVERRVSSGDGSCPGICGSLVNPFILLDSEVFVILGFASRCLAVFTSVRLCRVSFRENFVRLLPTTNAKALPTGATLEAQSKRKQTLVISFIEQDIPRPEPYLLHEWIYEDFRLMEEQLEMIQLNGVTRQVFIKCISTDIIEEILERSKDAAPYMVKTSKYLKLNFPNMIHVTCLAHACHRTAGVN
ncbi:hypothetical protein ANN_02981 [Periplaneta americana]|uniref:Uncharacterized protein n=1 Tax=Periplaneta americana TaxID=6978 RepID=A0ABQ8U0Y3_PERAM|nr:hypothetical protein ANN_02981 [Periplaneta americana]